ncbi:MAG: hypothetical protein ACFFE8_17205, partial [Candidatus Heimdallarchaeota archaeon]
MGENPILTELRYIQNLLTECLGAMEQIANPRVGNIFWRLIFPAAPFIQQKSDAKNTAAILLNIDARLRDMIGVLTETQHPNLHLIQELANTSYSDLAHQLIDLPERAQY